MSCENYNTVNALLKNVFHYDFSFFLKTTDYIMLISFLIPPLISMSITFKILNLLIFQ